MFPIIRPDQPAILLAPMEGITDAPAREFLSQFGGYQYLVTEFFRISQDVPGAAIFQRHAPELKHSSKTPAGMHVQFQLLGGDAEKMARSAAVAVGAGATAIDLNFGCPAPTVNRNDGGAALLKSPDRIEAIVRAVRTAVPKEIPVSAKLRLGWDSSRPLITNAMAAARGGATWLTIHARTRLQGYAPPTEYPPLRVLRAELGDAVPVIANGDLWTLDDLKRCQDETGCVHFMLGRSAMANPFLVHEARQWLGLPEQRNWIDPPFTRTFWAEWFRAYAEVCGRHDKEPKYALYRLKQWARIAHARNQADWFQSVKTAENTAEFIEKLTFTS